MKALTITMQHLERRNYDKAYKDYIIAQDELFLIRKFIEGEAAVKREGVKFCRIPNQLECNTHPNNEALRSI